MTALGNIQKKNQIWISKKSNLDKKCFVLKWVHFLSSKEFLYNVATCYNIDVDKCGRYYNQTKMTMAI